MNILLVTVLFTHVTIVCVTLYLHRCLSHRSVQFHPAIAHVMRAWLWLTTGMHTRQWVAVHRRHHQVTDQPGDPHSPQMFGIWTVLTTGMRLYNAPCRDAGFVMQYGAGAPKDWIERKLYTPYTTAGVLVMLAIDVVMFGVWGVAVWAIQMIWIPVAAGGLINGIGHWWGYRNGNTKDCSHNISPVGIVVAGEELHNNHHMDPASPKFSRRWWEFDIGWMYIKLFEFLKLAKIKSV